MSDDFKKASGETSDSSDLDVDPLQLAKIERKYAKIEKLAMERAMTQV